MCQSAACWVRAKQRRNKSVSIRTDKAGVEQTFYFINKAQGTPVLILDPAGQVVSKINVSAMSLREFKFTLNDCVSSGARFEESREAKRHEIGWGNPNPVMFGDEHEINFTGKKCDPETGLYYFNQRYYDPKIGRFLTEDPAGQAFNPYLYASNNPLMYVDPDGEFWFLVPMMVAAVQGAAISAVGQSAIGGALGGAFSFGVGEMFGHGVTDLGQFATKTLAHGVSSGLQNMIQGGDFGSGFMSGSIGHITGYAGGMIGGDVGGILGSGMGGGISSALSGGDFGRGFQSGAMQYMFNGMGEGLVNSVVEMVVRSAWKMGADSHQYRSDRRRS